MTTTTTGRFGERWGPAWADTWRALGAVTPPAGELERLLCAWSEPQRHYHTLQHLSECLEALPPLRANATHAAEVEAGLWFHDAVYDPQRDDNEARSAEWAREALLAAGVPAAAAGRVHALVMATCHRAEPVDADGRVLVDIDLSILGARPARFDQYDRQVRAEYAWVAEQEWRRGRRAVLESFLARDSIYSTAAMRAAREAMARANLQRALARL